jgi:hypothetical protein
MNASHMWFLCLVAIVLFVFQGLQKHEAVGAFQKIPMVMPVTDILMSAQRKSRNVPPTRGMFHLAIYYNS